MSQGRGSLLALFLLGGCSSISDALAPAYIPAPIRILDQARYTVDNAECAAAGASWHPGFSWTGMVKQTVDGATSDTSFIPLSPLVPLYGAAGGALGAANDGLDVMSGQHASVYRNCLMEETRRDGSAILADPRN